MTANTPAEFPADRRPGSGRIADRARYANVALGTWAFLSATLLPHTMGSGTNNWVVGILVAAFAFMAIVEPAVHRANALVALWLFCSTLWIFHLHGIALWNDLVTAVLVFVCSLVPTGQPRLAPPHPRTG